MTNLSNLKNEIKLESIKTFSAVIIVLLLGWGISSSAIDDIKSATSNFNVMGTVSKISDNEITVDNAKGSNSTSDTTYDLNLSHLEKIETSSYTPLNLFDIKVGDKIIAQGLTNNSTFFIKRIISFDSIPTPVEEKDVATSTATTTPMEDIVIATTTDVGTSTLTEEVIDNSTTPDSSSGGASTPSTPEVSTSTATTSTVSELSTSTASTTSTTTPDISTSTDNTSTSTDGIIDTITNTIEDVIDTVVDIVQSVVDTVTGSSTPQTPPTTPTQDITIQQLVDNSSSITSTSTE